MDDLGAYECRLKFDACRAELVALRAEREDRVALLEGLLREALDVLASVDRDGHRLKDRIEFALADGG